ncbi:hypothetical protein D910_00821 [Dendroctonus ponderosae]
MAHIEPSGSPCSPYIQGARQM